MYVRVYVCTMYVCTYVSHIPYTLAQHKYRPTRQRERQTDRQTDRQRKKER